MRALLVREAAVEKSRGWGVVAGLLIALVFFVWSGSGRDWGEVLPWGFTGEGWLLPARGLVMMLVGAGVMLGVLSRMAYLLVEEMDGGRKEWGWSGAFLILGAGVLVRVLVGMTWLRLPEGVSGMMGVVSGGFTFVHGVWIFVDVLTVGMLLLALYYAGRSPWWVALYALHPVVLVEVGGNGSWMAVVVLLMLMGVLLFAHLPMVVGVVTSVVTVGVSWHLMGEGRFGSLLGAYLPGWMLMGLQVAVQVFVLWVAMRKGWWGVRVVVHVLVVFLLFSPVVAPVMVLPVLVLLPMAWSRGGWVVSMMAMGGYLAIAGFGERQRWEVPVVVMVMMWVVGAVVEGEELFCEFFDFGKGGEEEGVVLAAGAGG